MKTRIKIRRNNKEDLPDNLEEAYEFLMLRTKQDREQLKYYKERYNELIADLVRLNYAEYDPEGDPGKVLIKLDLVNKSQDPRSHAERPNTIREVFDERRPPHVTYDNVTALFMTRTVFLWLVKRLGFVIAGVTIGYLLIDYVMRLYIPI